MDALGNPVHFLLTGGNIFDASVAVDLLSEVKISGSNILGDKACKAENSDNNPAMLGCSDSSCSDAALDDSHNSFFDDRMLPNLLF